MPGGLPRLPPVDRKVFADGLRTSGQHPPIESQLRPFEQFPRKIEGPTVWTPQQMQASSHEWIYNLEKNELDEIWQAVQDFSASGKPLTTISKASFRLPKFAPLLQQARREVLDGRGFVVLRGLPVERWGRHAAGVAMMGLSAHLGYLLSQNKLGLHLGHITDQGADWVNHLDKVKISATNAPQPYHTDETDIVGLLFCAPAASGGASGCASAHAVWNALISERPDVAETLASPIWYVDRKGETTDGQEPWIRGPVFMMEPGGQERVFLKWDPNFVTSLSRFSDRGLIPGLTAAQREAMEVLELTSQKLGLEYECEVGDVQFVSCLHTLHSRTGFVDAEPPAPPRYLLRTWMGTPEHEGGWCLPFHDSCYPKRGGVQVESVPPAADPLHTTGGAE
ncbi:taurine catabolism dioxygenase TauD [Microdochium bolleyi]|uniref:Taurine catabolism dioxygenase TauD n=1 Tax=Microdochium bolleyi TaxID=196109 RepID=A0A136ISZ1_9PEZI|nr:taurine catabolism dioxygenase TauD [Microdochium bolleyi]